MLLNGFNTHLQVACFVWSPVILTFISDVAVCQSVVQHCSLSKATTTESNDDNPKSAKDGASSPFLTVDTGNDITKLCNQILAEPGVETDSHDFAMIYMSMISPEADVEAIYLSPRSKEEN